MTYASLADLITALNAFALKKGFSPTKPLVSVVIQESYTSNKPVQIVISITEPWGMETPMNLLWLVADDQSPNYNKMLRRSNRTPSNGYTHTWSQVTDIANVWSEQAWDTAIPPTINTTNHVETFGNPHGTTAEDTGAIPLTGGQMTGPLRLRVPSVGTDYAPEEAVTRKWVDAILLPVRALAAQNNTFVKNLNSQFLNLRNRVVILEAAILGARVYVYTEDEPSAEWIVQHAMNKPNVHVTVYNEENEQVIPGRVQILDNNSLRITFAKPYIGRAEVGRY